MLTGHRPYFISVVTCAHRPYAKNANYNWRRTSIKSMTSNYLKYYPTVDAPPTPAQSSVYSTGGVRPARKGPESRVVGWKVTLRTGPSRPNDSPLRCRNGSRRVWSEGPDRSPLLNPCRSKGSIKTKPGLKSPGTLHAETVVQSRVLHPGRGGARPFGDPD